jgi:hypothetical protein
MHRLAHSDDRNDARQAVEIAHRPAGSGAMLTNVYLLDRKDGIAPLG